MIPINLPINEETRLLLRSGDQVLLTGYLFTGRDAAHKLMVEAIAENTPLPFPIEGECIYYTGPTPPKPNQVIGACGPTSSYRMDAYSIPLMEKGLKVMIGKGPRGRDFRENLIKTQSIYFVTTGGIGALLSKRVLKMELVAYPHLQSEAVYRLYVQDFPVIVAYDSVGNDIFEGAEE
jgi:fumarate hydratase subunit beta